MLYTLFFLGVIGLLIIAKLTPPEWINFNKWMRLNAIAGLIASLSFLTLFLLNSSQVITVCVSLLVYITTVSLYTDVKFRLVDRRSLNFLIVLSLVMASFSFNSLDEPNKITFIFLTLLSFSSIFLPIFGASDGRILTIGTLMLYPVGELPYFIIALIITTVIALIYAVFVKISKGVKKVSLPAVPMFSFSFLLTLLLKNFDIINVVLT